jgi:dephospho-CoA kinase
MTRKFLLVGLTGGIATGKSTVSDVFRRLGCVIIDADVLAREVVEPGQPAYADLVAEFGREILQPDGTLDRKKLGAIVFAAAAKRERLEAITHPRIRERFAMKLDELAARDFTGIVVFDAPVLIESGNSRTMDRLVVVATDEATQARRLRARDALDGAEAERRIASQMPVAAKAKLAHYVVDNSGDREATLAEVHRIHAALLADLKARGRAGD